MSVQAATEEFRKWVRSIRDCDVRSGKYIFWCKLQLNKFAPVLHLKVEIRHHDPYPDRDTVHIVDQFGRSHQYNVTYIKNWLEPLEPYIYEWGTTLDERFI